MKIEIRKTCKICGNPITEKRFRTYCSKKCRNKFFATKYNDSRTAWQRRKRDREALNPEGKCQCLLCGKWYRQVGTHIVKVHHMTCREYREEMDLEVKRGILPEDYRQEKEDIAWENGTVENLKAGKKFWFKKGDPKAGKYHRSHITYEKLKNLIKFTRLYKNKHNKK